MAVRIQLRRDTAANWISNNPVLREGEMGIETDTLQIKLGNGTSTWTQIAGYMNLVPDGNLTIGDYVMVNDIGAAEGVVGLDINKNAVVTGSSIILEGSTNNAYETTLTVTDPTADRTITFKNADGTVAFVTDIPSTTDALSEGSTNKYFTDERAQDATAAALAAGSHTNITVTYNDAANSLSLAAAPGYVDEQAVDAVAAALAAGTHTNISVSYDDAGNSISLTGAQTYNDENAQDAVGNNLGTGLSYNDTTGAISVNTSVIQARVSGVSDTEIGYLDGVTSSIQTQIDTKAPIASPTFTGTVAGITKSMVGLANVDNTTDTNKPVSTATQTALDLKAPLASPVFTGGISITNGAGLDSEGLIQAFNGLYVSGNTTLEGDLTVTGTTTTVNTINTAIADNMIYLNEAIHYEIDTASGDGTNQTYTTVVAHDITAGMFIRVTGITPSGYNLATFTEVLSVGNKTITVAGTYTGTYTSGGEVNAKGSTHPDLGFAGGYNDGTYRHAGLFRDASDATWKFFQGYEPEPDGLFIDTAQASFALAPLKVAAFEASSATIGDISNTELQYLNGVTSAIQTQLNAKAATADVAELAQDAVGSILGTGLTYNDATPGISIDNAALSNYLLEGASGNSYGLIGTSTYLDVKNTNGYNKEIELDIAAVKTQLDTDGYITTSSTSTLTNKTLTSPKINENVALTATATQLNYVNGVTSAIQTQLDSKLSTSTAASTYQPLITGVSDIEIGYLDGVTSGIQTQLDARITKSLVDAKGDILVGSADNTVARLGVGTDGYLLTADAASTNGIKWAAAPVSLPSQTGSSGKYLTTDGTSASWGTLVVPITTGTVTVNQNTAQDVDTIALSAFTSAEYMVSIKQGSKIRTSKVIIQTDGTSVDMTEFAITETGGTLSGVVVSATTASSNAKLQVTVTDALSTNATVKFSKIAL